MTSKFMTDPQDPWDSFLNTSGAEFYGSFAGTGPELKYAGSPVAAGQFGTWTPIGAEQTATGYEVAWSRPKTSSIRESKIFRARPFAIRPSAVDVARGNVAALSIQPLHQHMADDRLGILGDLHVVDLKMDRNVGDRLGLAAGIAKHRVTGHADRLGLFQRLEDVRRISGTRKSDQDGALARQHGELQRKYLLVTFVVSKTGNNGWIGRKRMDAKS